MKKQKAFLGLILFWAIFFVGFIGSKEYTVRTGQEVLLQTRPVDPRDLFRGDYVILSYEISRIESPIATSLKPNQTVYVLLETKDKLASAGSIMTKQPTQGLYIEGTVQSISGKRVDLKYGIESYFVPEGEGRVLERNRGSMLVNTRIDKRGKAVIRSLILDGEEVRF